MAFLAALCLTLLLTAAACRRGDSTADEAVVRQTAVVAEALRADPRLGTGVQVRAFSLADGGEGEYAVAEDGKEAIAFQRDLQFTPPAGVLAEQWVEALAANLTAQGFHVDLSTSPTADPPGLSLNAGRAETTVRFSGRVSSIRLDVSIVTAEPRRN